MLRNPKNRLIIDSLGVDDIFSSSVFLNIGIDYCKAASIEQ